MPSVLWCALALLCEHHEEHLAHKTWSDWMLVWLCLWNEVQKTAVVQMMPLPLYHVSLHYNSEWFCLSATGLPVLSSKRGHYMAVVVVVVVVVVQ